MSRKKNYVLKLKSIRNRAYDFVRAKKSNHWYTNKSLKHSKNKEKKRDKNNEKEPELYRK